MFWNKYPSTDMHELNLDWILAEIKKLHSDWSDFKILNSIRFYGEHDITKGYPAWALVSHDNIGYISTQIVPAGIDLDNIDYWKPIADYSALLADMQERIAKLESTYKKRIIFIGDSFNEGYPRYIKNWTEYVAEMMNLEANNYYNFAESGSGVASKGGHGHNYKELFQSRKQEIVDPITITDIIITLAYNDYNNFIAGYSDDDYIKDIKELFTEIKSTCKNAVIRVGLIGSHLFGAAIPWYYTRFTNCFNQVGDFTWLRNVEYIMINSTLLDDTSHPNEDGQKALANGLYSAILSGATDVIFTGSKSYIVPNSDVKCPIYANNFLYPMIVNDNTYINIFNDTIEFTSPKTIYSAGITQIGRIKGSVLSRFVNGITGASNLLEIKCFCQINGTTDFKTLYISISGDIVYITSTEEIQNVSKIQIHGSECVVIPTLFI